MLVDSQDKAGEFYRQFHYALFSYISHRIPEISDEVYRIDEAMKPVLAGRLVPLKHGIPWEWSVR